MRRDLIDPLLDHTDRPAAGPVRRVRAAHSAFGSRSIIRVMAPAVRPVCMGQFPGGGRTADAKQNQAAQIRHMQAEPVRDGLLRHHAVIGAALGRKAQCGRKIHTMAPSILAR
ncbi:hypothetical protein [Nocardia sp. NPDC050412]|uniref:hypothetical protein n=1 Tax=Nocardia sp. NPDC050412 TaxID=3364320 RepID=UPI0037A6DC9C